MFIPLVKLSLDPLEISLNRVFLFFYLIDFIVQLFLSDLALFQLQLNIARALCVLQLSFDFSDLVVDGFFVILGEICSSDESLFEIFELLNKVLSASLKSAFEVLDLFTLSENIDTFALASSIAL